MRWDRMGDPAKAVENHLYELQWPEVDQQGMASWYGPGFHGRKTANGERFNQFDLTAAHPTYAFGTQLCVRSRPQVKLWWCVSMTVAPLSKTA